MLQSRHESSRGYHIISRDVTSSGMLSNYIILQKARNIYLRYWKPFLGIQLFCVENRGGLVSRGLKISLSGLVFTIITLHCV